MPLVRGYWLVYMFLAFTVGVACLGAAVHLAVRRRDPVSGRFLAFYAALSVMVTASLVLAYADSAPGEISASVQNVFEYLESIAGLYGLMLTLPLLVHRVFGVEDARREKILLAVVLGTLGLQHLTEFGLGSTPWDQRGDWFEDGVLVAIMVYTAWVACSRLGSPDARRPLAGRLFLLLVLATPGMVFDLLFAESSGLRLYPFFYCVTSVVLTWTLVQDEAAPVPAAPPVTDVWGLSEREAEVAGGVARGLSNKEIAASLHISPNTVKTHMRSIFEKAGVRSRFELMAQMSGPVVRNHPQG